MTEYRLPIQTAAIALLNAILAGSFYAIDPRHPGVLLIGGLFVPVAWLLLWALRGVSLPGCAAGDDRAAQRLEGLCFGGSIITLSLLTVVMRKLGWIDGELGDRLTGVAGGMVIAYMGNMVPKKNAGASGRCDPAKRQATLRALGWIMVLFGLGLTLVWMIVPTEIAKPLAMLLIGCMIALLLIRAIVVPRLSSPTDGPEPLSPERPPAT